MKINRETYQPKTQSDKVDIFRGQHPDERSNREFLKVISQRFSKPDLTEGRWYPGKRGNPGYTARAIHCLTNGKTYNSIKEAREDLGIPGYNFAKHLKGDKQHSHIGGFRFKEL